MDKHHNVTVTPPVRLLYQPTLCFPQDQHHYRDIQLQLIHTSTIYRLTALRSCSVASINQGDLCIIPMAWEFKFLRFSRLPGLNPGKSLLLYGTISSRVGNAPLPEIRVVKFTNPTVKRGLLMTSGNLLLLRFTILANLPARLNYGTSDCLVLIIWLGLVP